jgi:hypothetical protein
MDAFPAIKFFSSSDQSQTFPTPITCTRVDKPVTGQSWSTWSAWFKLLKYLDDFPF